jgi:hypothetical protein
MTIWKRITRELVQHLDTTAGFGPVWVEIKGTVYQLGKFDKDNQTYELHPRITTPLDPPVGS